MAQDLMGKGHRGGKMPSGAKMASGNKIQSPVTGGGSSTPQSRITLKKRSFKGKR